MKQETRTVTRQANRRYGVHEVVTNPARSSAAYGGAFMAGLGICAMGWYLIDRKDMIEGGAVVAVIGMFLVGLGWAGSYATRHNFLLFTQYVLDSFVEDTEQSTETLPHGVEGTKAIPFTENGQTRMIELSDSNPLTNVEWRTVAEAIQLRGLPISEISLCRDNDVISQPKYKFFYNYMTKNNFIELKGGKNILTASGTRYLERMM